MRTALNDLHRWFVEGVRRGSSHMIVVCDTFDHEDYPVYVEMHEHVRQIVADYNTGRWSMQTVMEVYNLSKPFNKQIKVKHTTERMRSSLIYDRVYDLS